MNKRYVIAFPISLLAIFVLYAIFFQKALIYDQGKIPLSYKQLLLENTTPGNRIIFESGSNAHHSIDGETLEELTGHPVLILADNAGVYLPDKLSRLLHFTKPGDLIIMPLEWSYYTGQIHNEHLQHSMSDASHYFHSLKSLEKLKRTLETPISVLLNHAIQNGIFKKDSTDDDIKQLHRHIESEFLAAPYGGIKPDEVNPRKADPSSFGLSCDQYTYLGFDEHTPTQRNALLLSIELILKLKKQGINVVLIPPVVVGNDCYTENRPNFARSFAQLKSFLTSKGITFIGDPEIFKMSDEYYLDSPYHIIPEARKIYSIKLFELLDHHHIFTPGDKNTNTKETIGITLKQKLKKLEDFASQNLPPWNGALIQTNSLQSIPEIQFLTGWSSPETTHIWSLNKSSSIVFKPSEKAKNMNKIQLEANYFLVSELTGLDINGTPLESLDFSINSIISLPMPLSEYIDAHGLIKLTFKHTNPQRPIDNTDIQDSRLLKLQLKSISLKD